MAQRRNFAQAFKAKVVVDVTRAQKTINEIASIYRIHASLVNKRKQLALDKCQLVSECNSDATTQVLGS